MTNEDKLTVIHPWIDSKEPITVHVLDAPDLNATVTKCTNQSVDIAIKTHVLYMNQDISVPLSQVELSEDPAHDRRGPERFLQRPQLKLVINEKRPAISE